MFEMLSKAIFLDVLAVYLFCLYLSNNRQPNQLQTGKFYSNKDDLLLNVLIDLAQIFPMVYIFTPWFDFADYHMPLRFSVIGILLFVVALGLLGKAHSMVGHNFPHRMETGDKPTPVSQGVYHHIRHPIYAGFWLWSIAQPLLLHNWIAGFAMLAIFLPLYFVRVSREEQMLITYFRDACRKCIEQTGRVFSTHKARGARGGMVEGENTREWKVNHGNQR